MRLLLTLLNGEKVEYNMIKDSVLIGRSMRCDLVIPHESMSRSHCKIEVKDGDIFITDLGSINGVFIDGKQIPPNTSVPFHTYLHLAFGYVTSAQLMLDEKTRLGTINPVRKESEIDIPVSNSSVNMEIRTKTKALQTQKAEPPKNKKNTVAKSEKNELLFKGIAFIGILVALYYFLYVNKESTIENSQPQVLKASDEF